MPRNLGLTGIDRGLRLVTPILVSSTCFHAGFYIFTAQIKSQKGHKFKIQTKTYLVYISMVMIHPFCVSLLTHRHLKVRCHTDFV